VVFLFSYNKDILLQITVLYIFFSDKDSIYIYPKYFDFLYVLVPPPLPALPALNLICQFESSELYISPLDNVLVGNKMNGKDDQITDNKLFVDLKF
jgi:hypothetical protein